MSDTNKVLSNTRGLRGIRISYLFRIILSFSLILVLIFLLASVIMINNSVNEVERRVISNAFLIAEGLGEVFQLEINESYNQFLTQIPDEEDIYYIVLGNFSNSYNRAYRVPNDVFLLLQSPYYQDVSNKLEELRSRSISNYVAPLEFEPHSSVLLSSLQIPHLHVLHSLGVPNTPTYLVNDIPYVYIATIQESIDGEYLIEIVVDSEDSQLIAEDGRVVEQIGKRFYSGQLFNITSLPFQELLSGTSVAQQLYPNEPHIVTSIAPVAVQERVVTAVISDLSFQQSNLTAAEQYRFLLFVIAILVVFALILVVLFSFLLARPLFWLKRDTKSIAAGNHSTRIYKAFKDEFGDIADNINGFLEDITNKNQKTENVIQSYNSVFPKMNLDILGKNSMENIALGEYTERNMTVLHIHFTQRSQNVFLSPRDTIDKINSRIAIIEKIVGKYKGHIENIKLFSVTVIFPLLIQGALDSALEIQDSIDNQDDPQVQEALSCTMSIHYGPVVFGIVGSKSTMRMISLSEAMRIVYNLSHSIVPIGAKIVATQSYLDNISHMFRYHIRYMGSMPTGVTNTIKIYDVIDAYFEKQKKKMIATRLDFEEGVRMYEQGYHNKANDIMHSLHLANKEDRVVSYFNARLSAQKQKAQEQVL